MPTAAAPGASFYETCVDQVDNGDGATRWMLAGQALTRGLTGLTDGAYYWRVRATTQNGATEADLGAWWTITINAPDPIREYIYLGAKLLPTITLSTGAPVTSFYHTDALGSVRAITKGDGFIDRARLLADRSLVVAVVPVVPVRSRRSCHSRRSRLRPSGFGEAGASLPVSGLSSACSASR